MGRLTTRWTDARGALAVARHTTRPAHSAQSIISLLASEAHRSGDKWAFHWRLTISKLYELPRNLCTTPAFSACGGGPFINRQEL